MDDIMSDPPQRQVKEEKSNLMRLTIETHCWGISSGVPVPEAQQREVVTAKADPMRLSLTNRKLARCKEYTAIRSCDGAFRADLKRISLANPRRSSTFVIPMGVVKRVYERMDQYLEERKALVDKFVDDAYDKAVAEAKEKDPLFQAGNFPPKEEVRKAFWFDYDWDVEDVPAALKSLSSAAYDRERKRVAERLADVKTEGMIAIRASLQEILTTLLDKFTAPELDEKGKPKIKALRTTTINRVLELCDTFDELNLAGDEDAKKLVDELRSFVEGGDVETVKKNLTEQKKDPDLRKIAEPKLRAMKAAADELVQNAPTRRVSWDE